jgi:hypothetical protein
MQARDADISTRTDPQGAETPKRNANEEATNG